MKVSIGFGFYFYSNESSLIPVNLLLNTRLYFISQIVIFSDFVKIINNPTLTVIVPKFLHSIFGRPPGEPVCCVFS